MSGLNLFVLATDVAEEAQASGPDSSTLILLVMVFVLAVFVGFEIITKIPPTLHTPLMSGSNAISGITLIGALILTKTDNPTMAKILAVTAVALATMNAVGGFLVTHRMLGMFRKKG